MSDIFDFYKKMAKSSRSSQEWFELWRVLLAVADIQPQIIVEIGVFEGGFLETMGQAFPGALLIGIDQDFTTLKFNDFAAIKGDSADPTVKADLIQLLRDRPIDLLFIDADHHYCACKKDFENYSPLVRPGGLIGFHDTNNRGIDGVEVDRFMHELDKYNSYPTVDIKAGPKSPGTRLIWV